MAQPSAAEAAAEVAAAHERIRGRVYRTPLQRAVWLGPRVMLKLESEQVTGSFKARGAMNKVLALTPEERAKGLITASTGNHALAVTNAAQSLNDPNLRYEIVLPETASAAKVEHLRALGAPIRFHGKDCLLAEHEALRDARENGKLYISPYNDIKVLAGQGTLAVELFEQLQEQFSSQTLDAIFVPVGGGGLISGVAAHVKAVSPNTRVYGCNPKNDAHMARSVAAGKMIEGDGYLEEGGNTLSDGTAGAAEQGSVTFPLCCELVDEWLEITEEELGQAVVDMLDQHHKAVEGSAGLGIAGFRRKAAELEGKTVAIVVCGGNAKAYVMRDLLNKYLPAPTSESA